MSLDRYTRVSSHLSTAFIMQQGTRLSSYATRFVVDLLELRVLQWLNRCRD